MADNSHTIPGTLGIDFGTSNSAAAWRTPDGTSRLLALENGATGMPTALFFNTEEHRTHYGRDAMKQYLAPAATQSAPLMATQTAPPGLG